jgi:chemosensory pili system protein ChpA (sensor histidine kinase/response regulator)
VEEIDPEILEVFTEEAEEELAVIQRLYPQWRSKPTDEDALATMRRSFHTLKGSGRIVGAHTVGEFAWSIENLLNRVIDGTVAVSDDLLSLMDAAIAMLPTLVAECRTTLAGVTDISAVHDRAFALASPGTAATPATAAPGAPADAVVEVAADAEVSAPLPVETIELEPVEQDSLSDAIAETFERVEPASPAALDAVAMVAADEQSQQQLLDEPADESILTDSEAQDSEFVESETSSFSVTDSSLFAVFIDEANGHIHALGSYVERCAAQTGACEFDDSVRRAMHTLRGSARTADVESMAEVAEALEKLGDTLVSLHLPVDDRVLGAFARSHRFLLDVAAAGDAAGAGRYEWRGLQADILALRDALVQGGVPVEVSAGGVAASEPNPNDSVDPELLEVFLDEAKELLEAMEGELGDWVAAADGDVSAVARLQRTLHTMKGGARMSGVVTLGDLSHAMESAFESINEGRVVPDNGLRDLIRHAADQVAHDIDLLVRGALPVLHTAVIDGLEAAAHGKPWDPATAMAAPAASTEPPIVATGGDSQLLEPGDVSDSLLVDADSVDLGEDSSLLTDSQLLPESELLEDASYLVGGALPQEPGAVGSVIPEDSNVVQFPTQGRSVEGEGFVERQPKPERQPAAKGAAERVRVASESLDQMVNNAGEVSIYRARIEQQNNSFAFNLGELGQTIERLRGQLRDLELETEAQILSRHEREGDVAADFDPLEMDRYSTIQQLSRALSETVEDLSNLGQSLGDLSRDTDTLLLQQARVTTDLQDSLLRTRMVKFASRVPRLERVVRQTAHSVAKDAMLKVVGGHEDMDRAILERMMGPLEHLLRNAVSHGIEDADSRVANGKPPQGVVTLAIAREGADVVITLADDGAGLDKARIRAKAVERGLIPADAQIADDDIYQLILQPGFSTAEQLSQVSGRGVGMDVVLTEVKQLGGTLEIDSQPGAGSSFTIRLPFTLAITDSLLVTLGDDIYAVPHSSMDGVVRITFEDLRAIYDGQLTSYEYAGRKYNVRYLGMMLGTQMPHLTEAQRWYPLLLVRSGEHRVAIQVDSLMGNRQIVVKSVGAQLSTVRWFTGGTILADGQIALILDMNSLVRADNTNQMLDDMAAQMAEPEAAGVSVMVVDDSITVRKVTSRLLERHNMQVITAKDGVDAVSLLQEHRPHVVLLDIEMPRMDGYELARHMRSTPELSRIPIIMITSRSGDKHRKRALELGVKRYLGKPYQEAELLENIYAVLADAAL